MALIEIKNLRTKIIIGVFDEERTTPQEILINLDIEYDDTKASASDNIIYALDYDTLSKKILSEIEKTQFNLIEKLCSFILELIILEPEVNAVKVKIDKPSAIKSAESVSVSKQWKK
jgi:FolB domain-containing protein